MSLIQILEDAKRLDLVDAEGEPVELNLLPGLSESEISELENDIGTPLPSDVRELLAYSRGFETVFEVDFTGGLLGQASDFLEKSLTISIDGFGNSWELDLTDTWGPIYFVCHDPPVVLYQCEDLETFLREMIKVVTPPHKSMIDEVAEDRPFKVWLTNPGLIAQTYALSSDNPELRAFAQELDSRWFIKDMRNAKPGDGISWGKFGPTTECRRFGKHRLFAIRQPEPNFLQRLFGKK